MIIAALSIFAPLIAAATILMLRRLPGEMAVGGMIAGLIASVITLWRVADGARFEATLPGLPDLPLLLAVDPIAAILSTVVAVVSTFVIVYAIGYMADDDDKVRFFAGMAFFVAAMQTLVLAGDWILFLVAWELIALASWLLIGFWYDRPGVGRSATWAFVVTRAADFGLYLGAILLITETGTSAISESSGVSGSVATTAGLAFLLAAVGKSAQAPLQGWLQDAMVGPTPVSALLHAATLVIAGVVLLVRGFPLLPSGMLIIIGLVGGISSVITGLIAVTQRDLKRLLAASTSSQLGLMLLALGAGSVPAAIVHLVAHAAMKSSLFLAAGVFQHDRESTAFDDLEGIGRERKAIFAGLVVAGLALAGVPPLAGFWSKDAVIAATFHSTTPGIFVPLAVAASLLTGVYVARAIRLLWQGDAASGESNSSTTSTERWMGCGLGALAVLAAGLGLAIGSIGTLLNAEVPEDLVSVVVGLIVAIIGLSVGWWVPVSRLLGPLFPVASAGFRIGGGWSDVVAGPALMFARWCDALDRLIHASVHGAGRRALGFGSAVNGLDSNVHSQVEGVGRSSLRIAQASRSLDQDGIDGFIDGIVSEIRHAGSRARRLQTGLVHRELLVAVGGAALMLIVVLIT